MNKTILILVVTLAFASCKSDGNSVNNGADSQASTSGTLAAAEGNSVDANASATAAISKDSLSQASNDASKDGVSSEKVVEKKTKKRVKRKSFNPPHIAVLEQDEYEAYEQEVEEKPKAEVIEKKAEKTKKEPNPVVKTKPKVEAKKVVAKKVEKAKPIVAPKPAIKSKTTEIVFRRNFFSFGDIIQGDTVKFNFDFTNIGEAPLIIENAKGSCSCTLPEYPLLPIPPGESGKISGIYVSDGKIGPQNASVTITANTEPITHQLLLDGKVAVAEATDEEAGDQN